MTNKQIAKKIERYINGDESVFAPGTITECVVLYDGDGETLLYHPVNAKQKREGMCGFLDFARECTVRRPKGFENDKTPYIVAYVPNESMWSNMSDGGSLLKDVIRKIDKFFEKRNIVLYVPPEKKGKK